MYGTSTRKLDRRSKVCFLSPNIQPFHTDISCLLPDWDFVFADDERESNPTSFKFMQMAHAWKQAQAKTAAAGGSGVLSGFAAAKTAQESDEEEDEESEEEKSDLASSQDEDE